MKNPRHVKALMALQGLTCVDVARVLSITPNAVSKVVRGAGRSRRVEVELARRLGRPVDELFGPSQQRSSSSVVAKPTTTDHTPSR